MTPIFSSLFPFRRRLNSEAAFVTILSASFLQLKTSVRMGVHVHILTKCFPLREPFLASSGAGGVNQQLPDGYTRSYTPPLSIQSYFSSLIRELIVCHRVQSVSSALQPFPHLHSRPLRACLPLPPSLPPRCSISSRLRGVRAILTRPEPRKLLFLALKLCRGDPMFPRRSVPSDSTKKSETERRANKAKH